MQLLKIRSFLFVAIWCHLLLEISSAPSAPFKPSPRLASPLDPSDQLAISYLEKEASREKRGSAHGSGDILNHIKTTIGQGIKNKIGQIAKSSAGASAYFSKSSSAHHHGPPEHGHFPHYPPHYYHHPHIYADDHGKGVDFWGLKKSVLYTLLQAVKAIKGGVIAIKGQLIKGGGHLLKAKGKILKHGGDALTTFGKSIASSAFMIVPTGEEAEEIIHEDHHHHHHHHQHQPSSGFQYTGPTAPVVPLSGPPASYHTGTSGGAGYYHNSVYDGKLRPQEHDGLILLRKIPKHLHHHDTDSDVDTTNDEQSSSHHETSEHNDYEQQHYEHQQDVQESQKTPAFRPLSDGIVPKMKNLVTSVFHSSSYNPLASSPNPGKTVVPKYPPNDNTISHSAHYNSVQPKPTKNQIQVQPQQASIGSLVNYLEYIRNQQKDTKTNTKGKPVMYVTPAPTREPKPSKLEDHDSNNQLKPQSTTAQSQKVTHQDLKKETTALQQQLQQLQSLQRLQQQLQLMYPYAVQGQEQLPAHDQLDYTPVMLDLPANTDLATLLAQYHIVPEDSQNQFAQDPRQTQYVQEAHQFIHAQPQTQHIVQLQNPQPQAQQLIQILPQQYHQPQHQVQSQSLQQAQAQAQSLQQLQNLYQMEEPLEEADSSNTFLIHYPDDESDEVQGRSLQSNIPHKPKIKRHSHSNYPTTKLKRLSHLQQLQMMQQQLHHPQHPKKLPTIDVIRSLKVIN